MSRPSKSRRVCALPSITEFGPYHTSPSHLSETITLSVDEYETLRLIDYEGMTQEECATQMNIARTTAQKIYNSGRTKLVTMLLNGSKLNIRGGRITLCEDGPQCGRCRRKQGNHNL